MKTLIVRLSGSLFISSIFLFSSAYAGVVPRGFSSVGTRDIQEDDVTFTYASNDGTFELKCTHVYDQPSTWDWDVWCGKGTNMLKIFRVHFLLRQYKGKYVDKTAFEVLYWVTDRNHLVPTFSSSTQWLQFKNLTEADELSFAQGLENDYASLKLTYHPSKR